MGLENIYLLLTGENEKKRPRSKALITILSNTPNLNWENTKIIVTGKSGFTFNVEETEAKKTQKFLIKNNIPKENILLEEEAMDTLGNMVFSFYIIEKLILKEQGNTVKPKSYPKIKIHLITERFHLNRSKGLFLQIFGTLKSLNPNISFKFHKINEISTLNYFFNKKSKKYLIEHGILQTLINDITTYNLQTPEEFINFLFSMPIYNEHYTPTIPYNTSLSSYRVAINELIKKKKKNN